MEIYITRLLQVLSFSRPFRRFEMKNFLRRPTMVADNISLSVAPQNFFHFYGPVSYQEIKQTKNLSIRKIVVMQQ